MPDFKFRLRRVLEYRELQEKWAKDAYLEVRSRLVAAEVEWREIGERRTQALRAPQESLEGMISLENYLHRLDDDDRAQCVVIEVIKSELAKAEAEWIETKRALESIQRLRDKAYEEWLVEENRREQAELDEWSVTRRRAA